MTDRRCDASGTAPGEEPGGEAFDYSALLDELRCHSSEWLEDRRVWLVREQRRLHLEELAVLSVLDERGKVDDTQAGKDGTTTKTVRRKRRTAQRLKRQPKVAEAAAKGKLSEEQLDRVTVLAGDDPELVCLVDRGRYDAGNRPHHEPSKMQPVVRVDPCGRFWAS